MPPPVLGGPPPPLTGPAGPGGYGPPPPGPGGHGPPPPGGFPPPAPGTAPGPPPKKKGKKGLVLGLLFGLVGLLVLCLGSGVGVWVVVFNAGKPVEVFPTSHTLSEDPAPVGGTYGFHYQEDFDFCEIVDLSDALRVVPADGDPSVEVNAFSSGTGGTLSCSTPLRGTDDQKHLDSVPTGTFWVFAGVAEDVESAVTVQEDNVEREANTGTEFDVDEIGEETVAFTSVNNNVRTVDLLVRDGNLTLTVRFSLNYSTKFVAPEVDMMRDVAVDTANRTITAMA